MKSCLQILAMCAALGMLHCASASAANPPDKSHALAGRDKADAIIDETVNQLWEIADVHWHKGEYNHIVNICKVTAAMRPNYMDAYSDGGWLLWSMGRDDEAVAFYEQGLKANPNSFSMYDELGFYFFNRKKDYPRAIGYYEKAVSFKDCQPFTIHMLANAYERNKQFEKALKMWERAAAAGEGGPAKVHIERLRAKLKQS